MCGDRDFVPADRMAALLEDGDPITDKGFESKPFERSLSAQGIRLLRPSREKEVLRPGEPMLKKVRRLIESVNDTLKASGALSGRHDLGKTGCAVRSTSACLSAGE
ncbi:hypothetical protein ACFZAR_39880, partial [Streptomyces sp. NPDC008222]